MHQHEPHADPAPNKHPINPPISPERTGIRIATPQTHPSPRLVQNHRGDDVLDPGAFFIKEQNVILINQNKTITSKTHPQSSP